MVVIGTGGTIAGTGASDPGGYRAAQLPVQELMTGLLGAGGRVAAGCRLQFEQVAQVDSKDMSHAVWRRLAVAVERHLAQPQVRGVVITHGTDTLEETAYLLQRVLAPSKPVVLTAAMRPADSIQADGPANLFDALVVAVESGAQGAVVVVNGTVWSGAEVRKSHPYRLSAFDAGDSGALAHVEGGRLRRLRPWPGGIALGLPVLDADIWPEVQIVVSHAGADGHVVDLLCRGGVQGIVVGCTGNGTVHQELFAALLQAQARGVTVLRALRGGSGSILTGGMHDALPHAGSLTLGQARVELLLRLLARSGHARGH